MVTINSNTIQQMLLDLRNAFLDDMPEKLDRLESLLLEIEKNGASSEAFNEFYRIVHSLKGSGGTHGLHIITTICHQLEDLLNTTDGGNQYTPALISSSLNYVDLLRMSTDMLQAGDENFLQIEKQLNQLRNQLAPKQFTVLIVDNSKLSTHMYLQTIAGLPIRPVVMNDGLQALMRALTEPFDLLVTTNEIPVLNGLALIGALKLSRTKNSNIKSILITSNKNITEQPNRTTDADYIVTKDMNLAQNLVNAVKQSLLIK
jgi:chemotaxis protein histidine kinase CheA